jgi:hypothetical protein
MGCDKDVYEGVQAGCGAAAGRGSRATADAAGVDWKFAVYQKVEEEVKAGGRLTVERMVELGRVSRSGFYRFSDTEPGPDPDMDLRDAIQKIAVEWPSYGRPRITAELRPPRLGGERETRLPADERGQSVVRAEAEVRRHDGF